MSWSDEENISAWSGFDIADEINLNYTENDSPNWPEQSPIYIQMLQHEREKQNEMLNLDALYASLLYLQEMKKICQLQHYYKQLAFIVLNFILQRQNMQDEIEEIAETIMEFCFCDSDNEAAATAAPPTSPAKAAPPASLPTGAPSASPVAYEEYPAVNEFPEAPDLKSLPPRFWRRDYHAPYWLCYTCGTYKKEKYFDESVLERYTDSDKNYRCKMCDES